MSTLNAYSQTTDKKHVTTGTMPEKSGMCEAVCLLYFDDLARLAAECKYDQHVNIAYTYNSAGDLTQDANKGLSLIDYDLFGHPRRIQHHNGNVRLVVDGNGNVEQRNDYYAYGGPWGDNASTQGFQPFKYNGKELDRMHGLDWYDYGARMYDPAMGLFTQVDLLAEQYPHLNPYMYCAGNPVKYVDPDGKDPIYAMSRNKIKKIGDDGQHNNRSFFVLGNVAKQVRKATKRGLYYFGSLQPGDKILSIPTNRRLQAIKQSVDDTRISNRENGGHYNYNEEIPTRWDQGTKAFTERSGDLSVTTYTITPFYVNSKDVSPADYSSIELLWHVHPNDSNPSDADKSYLEDLSVKGFHGNSFVVGANDGKVSYFNQWNIIKTFNWQDFVKMANGLMNARIMEQLEINRFGLQKNGGQLFNLRNEISPKYWGKFGIKM